MANHALPTNISLFTDWTQLIKDRIDDSLKMLDSANTTPTNIPINAVRWNSTSLLWEKYNGSTWVSLTSSYTIQVLKSQNIVGGNNTTLLGSIPYQSNTNTTTLLAPNTTTTRKFLRQIGTGTNGANPVWDTIQANDIPTLNQNSTGNAGTATKLATARTINGVSFDGSANINIEDRLGSAIASAVTTTIGTAGIGDYIHITGTTTITSLGIAASAGIRRTLVFDGALTLTHNATSLICVGATNIVTVAGTVIIVIAETTANWRVVSVTHPSVSMSELGYLNGVTSPIQTQFNAKAPLESPTFSGNIKTNTGSFIIGTGGSTEAGCLYSDPNWGMIIKAKQANPTITCFSFQNSVNYELARINNIGDILATRTITGTSPNVGSTGAVSLRDSAGNPNSVYLQATNYEQNVQYGSIKFNNDGSLTPSGVINGTTTMSLGYGQSWGNYNGSRVLGVAYTNTTGRPIMVSFMGSCISATVDYRFYIDGTIRGGGTASTSVYSLCNMTFIVPNGSNYGIGIIQGSGSIQSWDELR